MTVAIVSVLDYESVATLIGGLVGGTVETRWRSQPKRVIAPSGVDATGNPIVNAALPMPSNVGFGTGAKIVLSVVVDAMLSTSDVEYGDPDPDTGLMPTQTTSQYEATWQVRIEADVFPTGLNLAKRIQRKIWYDGALDALRALGIVLRNTTNANCYPMVWGNRAIEYTTFDLLVSYGLTDAIDDANATGYIETMDDPVGTIT